MRLFLRRFPLILSVICLLAFLAVPAAAISFRPQGGISTTTLNSLYCQLTGCTMTGTLTTSTGASADITLSSTTPTITTTAGKSINLSPNGSGLVVIGGTTPTINSGTSALSISSSGAGSTISLLAGGGSAGVVLKSPLLSSTNTTTNAGSGSCTSVTVSGTILDYTITATCTAAQTVVVTYSVGFGAQPNCTASAGNSAAGGVTTGTPYPSAGSSTSTTWTFPAVTAGKWTMHCML